MNILIANRQRVKKIDTRLLRQIVAELLNGLGIANAGIEINLVNAGEMAALNETFLGHEGSTDVITFDYAEGPRAGLTGEIFICVDDAIVQARKFKTNWQSEVARYIVHGLLHLLGHDDLRADRRQKMKRRENQLVRKLAKKFSLAQIGRPSNISA